MGIPAPPRGRLRKRTEDGSPEATYVLPTGASFVMDSLLPCRHLVGRLVLLLSLALAVSGCDSSLPGSSDNNESGETDPFESCVLATDRLIDSGVPKDGIPALTNPPLVGADSDHSSYLTDSSRVIGLLDGDTPLAVPHNILWHHEIVNVDDRADRDIAVTYCPLTGSSLAFDRAAVDGAEFGVSGLLLDNNLVMYDRREREALWPQMKRDAQCGANVGTSLEMVPVIEMRWDHWKTLHPNTKVLSSQTGHGFLYSEHSYPYGNYEQKNNDRLLFDGTPIDERRPPKERLLGIPDGPRGIAFPYGELNDDPIRVIDITANNKEMVVFWSRDAQAAMAYETSASFSVEGERIVDDETGSTWTVEGRAIDGARKGDTLEPVQTAYVAFWFAWAVFQPGTKIWTNSS